MCDSLSFMDFIGEERKSCGLKRSMKCITDNIFYADTYILTLMYLHIDIVRLILDNNWMEVHSKTGS